MRLASEAFQDSGEIPSKYTCDGDNVSPPLEWSDVPPHTKSVALICDDPDAPKKNFTHWLLFDRPPDAAALPEHVAAKQKLPDGGCQGKNDFGTIGYGGPCPPSGTHHYRFTLYALDTELGVPPSSTRREIETAMKGHVLETARLTGLYKRAR